MYSIFPPSRTAQAARRQRGITLVELLVAAAVGLLIVAGAISLFASHLGHTRRLLVEARVNQDLRVAADLIARDLRRAAYWGHAIQGTSLPGAAATPTRNPYGAITPDAAAPSIGYALSRDAIENGTLDNNEQFGFRLNRNEQTIQMQTAAGTWQTVTDPSVMTIPSDGLAISVTETPVDVRSACARACTAAGCPTLLVRHYTLTLKARAASDGNVVRRLETRVRVRNDRLAGQCPA
jgi:prepilin peptidase dependent protein B